MPHSRRHSYSEEPCSICATLSWDGCIATPTEVRNKIGRSRGGATALQSLWDGSKTGKREQQILTPQWLITALQQEWGWIGTDPCSEGAQHIPATRHYVRHDGDNGLAVSWTDRTYANPPYVDLRDWLAKAVQEAQEGYRIALLGPVRTHRAWYSATLDTVSAAIELRPVKFEGFDQAFPAPLHLLCWNWIPTPHLWINRGTVRKMVKV